LYTLGSDGSIRVRRRRRARDSRVHAPPLATLGLVLCTAPLRTPQSYFIGPNSAIPPCYGSPYASRAASIPRGADTRDGFIDRTATFTPLAEVADIERAAKEYCERGDFTDVKNRVRATLHAPPFADRRNAPHTPQHVRASSPAALRRAAAIERV